MTRFPFFLAILSGLIACSTTYGVVIAGGDGTGNTNDEPGLVGWDYVGRVQHPNNRASVTYLGHDWFITANHVYQSSHGAPTGIIFNGSTYSINASSWKQITNNNSTVADLAMFRANGNFSHIPDPTISASTPSSGTDLTMIGYGRNRESNMTYWDASWNETNEASAAYTGYKIVFSETKRWGVNDSEGEFDLYTVDTKSFYTDFDNNYGEAQGARYDSGGGVFSGTTSNWELAGIMWTTLAFQNQPPSGNEKHYVHGNLTLVADLSEYRDQIVSTIPEPLSAGIVLSMTAVAVILKRIRLWFA
jgi:hypothetical protein